MGRAFSVVDASSCATDTWGVSAVPPLSGFSSSFWTLRLSSGVFFPASLALSPFSAMCFSSPQVGSSVQVGRSPLLPRKRMGDLCNTAFSSCVIAKASSWTDTARRCVRGFMRGRGLGRLSSVTDCAFSERSGALGPLHGDRDAGRTSFLGEGTEAAPRGYSCAGLSADVLSCVCGGGWTLSAELLEGGAQGG